MGLTRTSGRWKYAGEALAERGRCGVESRANKPIPLGSPFQMAGAKTAVLLMFHCFIIYYNPIARLTPVPINIKQISFLIISLYVRFSLK